MDLRLWKKAREGRGEHVRDLFLEEMPCARLGDARVREGPCVTAERLAQDGILRAPDELDRALVGLDPGADPIEHGRRGVRLGVRDHPREPEWGGAIDHPSEWVSVGSSLELADAR